ncbi:MAG: hypothetical protein JNL72_04795 [Flavipsychrobacter sp.]|nr:hypothetical protein [Flavipsychrobacter sp.]
MKSRFICLLYCAVCFYILLNGDRHRKNFYLYDKFGYHAYLPAVFVYNDLAHLSFYPEIIRQYEPFGSHHDWHMVVHCPDERKLIKYPPGVALFNLPLFLAAHTYASSSDTYPADGYSIPYVVASISTNILCATLGLLVLGAFLRRRYSDTATAITLACIGFGTNLYTYTAFDQGMSHPYCFLLLALLLHHTDSWYRTGMRKHLYLLAASLGMLFLTRSVDVIAVLLPLAWGVYNRDTLRARLRLWWQRRASIAMAAVLLIAIVSIHFVYTRWISGSWVVDTYPGEAFDFLNPRLRLGLLGFQKGWFVYTPIALVAMSGFYFLWKQHKAIVPSLLLYLATIIYVVFSWKQWHYGGGFSARALVDVLPAVAVPLCALAEAAWVQGRRLSRALFACVSVFCITLNMFQTYQYTSGVLHWNNMSAAYYWYIFGKTKVGPESWPLLMTDEEVRETEQ